MNKKTIKSEETNNMKKVKLATLATLGAFTISTTLSPALVEQASAKESVKDIWDNTGESKEPEVEDYEGGVTTEGEDEIVDIDKILEEINGGGNSEPVIEEYKDIWDNEGESKEPEEEDYEGGVVGDDEDEIVNIPTVPTEPVEPDTPVEDEVEEPTVPTEPETPVEDEVEEPTTPSEPVEEDEVEEDKDIWDNEGESKEPEEEDYEGGVVGDDEDETVVIPPTVPTEPNKPVEDDKGKDNVTKPTPKPEDNKGKDNVTKPTPKPEDNKGKDNVTKPTPKPTSKTYTVKRGDTLYAIAKANGTTVAKLAKDNGIKNVNFLSVGQKLVIKGNVTKPKEPVNNANKGGNGTVNTKVVHTVKRGDTLYSIAKSYGTNINTLAKDNKIKNVNFIKVGQKIVVNGKAPVTNVKGNQNVNKGVSATYVVKKGDNLTKIAKKYGTTVNKIVKDNKIANKNLIFVNQKLIIKK